MSAFPSISSVPYMNPLKTALRFKTLIGRFDDLGAEVRKRKWLYPRRDITLKYRNITKSEARILWLFYLNRGGSCEAFNWFSPFSDIYEGEYVGTGDGSTTTFNLPSVDSSSRTLYVDGSAQTEGTDYTFAAAGGADGADSAVFASAPASGARITYDFAGRLKVRARFADDALDWDSFYDALVVSGLTLRGLLNA